METGLIQNAQAYASRRQLQLAERLGFGVHGMVFVADGNSKAGNTALKAHHSAAPYLRERDAYQRLRETGLTELLGFQVPQLIGHDDELLVIEMTIVTRPFLLDFAGAWLDVLQHQKLPAKARQTTHPMRLSRRSEVLESWGSST